jgi:hypothetical protein
MSFGINTKIPISKAFITSFTSLVKQHSASFNSTIAHSLVCVPLPSSTPLGVPQLHLTLLLLPCQRSSVELPFFTSSSSGAMGAGGTRGGFTQCLALTRPTAWLVEERSLCMRPASSPACHMQFASHQKSWSLLVTSFRKSAIFNVSCLRMMLHDCVSPPLNAPAGTAFLDRLHAYFLQHRNVVWARWRRARGVCLSS